VAGVIAVRELELKTGVTEATFERFVREEYLPAWNVPGMRVRIMKGDRGSRAGLYLHLFEFESVETRDRYFPPPEGSGASDEFRRYAQSLAPVIEKLWSLAVLPSGYTDYVEL
jgi:hypothetical protein